MTNLEKNILLSIAGVFLIANCNDVHAFSWKNLVKKAKNTTLGQTISSSASNIKTSAKQTANTAIGTVSTTASNAYNSGSIALSSDPISQKAVILINAAKQARTAQSTYNNAVITNGGTAPNEAAIFKNAVNDYINAYNNFIQVANTEVATMTNQANLAQ